jgi:hypothetical protein
MVIAWIGVSGISWANFEAWQTINKGTVELGFQTGYWQANTGIGNADSGTRSAVFFLPQIGYVLTDELEAGYFSGAWEVFLEPVGAHFIKPFSASLFGGTFNVKYDFLSFGRWMPYWDAGFGGAWTDLAPRIPEESGQFQFIVQTGPGVQYFTTETSALTAGVRFYHLSDGGIGDRNVGINAWLFLLGFSFYTP